jgi:hypothetical protein
MSSSAVTANPAGSQPQTARQPSRQTRTNPSRISKTAARSYSFYGHPSNVDAPPTPAVPHGFYPALTHFTDAVAALPREFRRHNALLKEVDAKAWALEESLSQLLKVAFDSEPVPCPPNPAPIADGVVRDGALPTVSARSSSFLCLLLFNSHSITCFIRLRPLRQAEWLLTVVPFRPCCRIPPNQSNLMRAKVVAFSSIAFVIPSPIS